jgi:hypothetical protein
MLQLTECYSTLLNIPIPDSDHLGLFFRQVAIVAKYCRIKRTSMPVWSPAASILSMPSLKASSDAMIRFN